MISNNRNTAEIKLNPKIEEVYPVRAQALLDTMEINRRVSHGVIKGYAGDMIAGRWMVTHQGIAISTLGRLIDGEHRLRACVLAGVPFKTMVTYDIPPELFYLFDSGRVRPPSDVLYIGGFKDEKLLAGSVRLAMNCDLDDAPLAAKRSRREVLEYANDNPWLCDVLQQVHPARTVLPATALAAVIFLSTKDGRHRDMIPSFIDGLVTLANLPKGDARHTLAMWANRERAASKGRWRAEDVFDHIVIAWNAYISGRELRTIRVRGRTSISTLSIVGHSRPTHLSVVSIAA